MIWVQSITAEKKHDCIHYTFKFYHNAYEETEFEN